MAGNRCWLIALDRDIRSIRRCLCGRPHVLFILAISQAWARGLSIDCGCFGGAGKLIPVRLGIYLRLCVMLA